MLIPRRIWKQKELIEFLQQGLELQVEGAGLEELQEAYMKLADLYNRNGDMGAAREAMKQADKYMAEVEAQYKARVPSSKSSRPGTSASRPGTSSSIGARSRPGTSVSTNDTRQSMRSRPNKGSLEAARTSSKEAAAAAVTENTASSSSKEDGKAAPVTTAEQPRAEEKGSTKSEAEAEAEIMAKEEMAKLILKLKAQSEEPRNQAHSSVIAESTRMQEKVLSILDKHLEEASQLAQAEISGKSRKFRFWYEDCLHQTERILSSNKVRCKEILAKQIDAEKEEWMHAAQLVIDEQQETNELVALILVEELVEAYRVEDEDRVAWQLQSNNEVARVCEKILSTWRERAAKQKDDENNILRERHHAEALARQRSLISTASGNMRDRSPTKSPSPVRGGSIASLGEGCKYKALLVVVMVVMVVEDPGATMT